MVPEAIDEGEVLEVIVMKDDLEEVKKGDTVETIELVRDVIEV